MRLSINNFNSLFKSNYKSTVFTKTYKMRHLIHPFDKNIPVSAVIFPRISTSVRYLTWTCMDSFVFTVENIILRVFIFEQPPSAKISFYWKKNHTQWIVAKITFLQLRDSAGGSSVNSCSWYSDLLQIYLQESSTVQLSLA